MYKVVSKILTTRLKEVMYKPIDEELFAFVGVEICLTVLSLLMSLSMKPKQDGFGDDIQSRV